MLYADVGFGDRDAERVSDHIFDEVVASALEQGGFLGLVWSEDRRAVMLGFKATAEAATVDLVRSAAEDIVPVICDSTAIIDQADQGTYDPGPVEACREGA